MALTTHLHLIEIRECCEATWVSPDNSDLVALTTSWARITGTHNDELLAELTAVTGALEVHLNKIERRLTSVIPAELAPLVAHDATWESLANAHTVRAHLRTVAMVARINGSRIDLDELLIPLPPLTTLTGRPLLDAEIAAVRVGCYLSQDESIKRRVTCALAETSAGTGEIPQVRSIDINIDPVRKTGAVQLPGTGGKVAGRSVVVNDPWVADQLCDGQANLVDRQRTTNASVAYYDGRAEAKSTTSQAVSATLIRSTLRGAGLVHEPDVLPSSLRNTAGRKSYAETSSITAAGRVLGKTNKNWIQDTYKMVTFDENRILRST